MTPAEIDHYRTNGYIIRRDVVDSATFERVEEAFQNIQDLCSLSGASAAMHSPEFAWWLAGHRGWEQSFYETMREHPALGVFATNSAVAREVHSLFDCARIQPKAARFRMDQPHDTRYLAVWHQDHAYVGGSTDTVTAWVPLQDTDWVMGTPLLMPGTHKFGPLIHGREVNGRKCPDFEGPLGGHDDLHMVEMKRGDVLLFHSLLLHSGQVNLSDRVRYSIQVRYEPL